MAPPPAAGYNRAMQDTLTIGEQLRGWRQRRRLSQLDLALDAEISTRHLSFIETGRATPSRAMVLKLADQLDVPLRERNALLVAAGFAPAFRQTPQADLTAHPAMAGIGALLAAHEPFPALAIDRGWTLVAANRAVGPLMDGAAAFLVEPPVNVLRLSLHPEGLAPRIVNLRQWRDHLLHRLRRQFAETADAGISALIAELLAYPAPPGEEVTIGPEAIAVPLRLSSPAGVLSFLSTTMVFGTPLDVTLSELAIETFLPADEATSLALGGAVTPRSTGGQASAPHRG